MIGLLLRNQTLTSRTGALFKSRLMSTFSNSIGAAGLAALRIFSPNPAWYRPYISPLYPQIPTVAVQVEQVFEGHQAALIATLVPARQSSAACFGDHRSSGDYVAERRFFSKNLQLSKRNSRRHSSTTFAFLAFR
jgi:hypothetical protein